MLRPSDEGNYGEIPYISEEEPRTYGMVRRNTTWWLPDLKYYYKYKYKYIESNNEAISHLPDIPYCKFDKFKEVTLPDTKDILSKAKKSYCERDSFPIGDIKEQRNIDRLTGVIHKITNLSLENGSFPKTEKEAIV